MDQPGQCILQLDFGEVGPEGLELYVPRLEVRLRQVQRVLARADLGEEVLDRGEGPVDRRDGIGDGALIVSPERVGELAERGEDAALEEDRLAVVLGGDEAAARDLDLPAGLRSEEHTSELQSRENLV